MRHLPLLLLLAACPTEPAASDTDDDPQAEPQTDAPPELNVLPIPKDAVDLDADPDVVRVELRSAEHTFDVGGDSVQGYAYNGQVPGPTIRAKLGDRVEITLTNDLDVPTTIHWHGLHVPFQMDGVPWTIPPIESKTSFTYTFTVEQAGSFWYHPHFDTERQVDLGLYGAFIVADPNDPAVDLDIPVMADSWGEVDSRTPSEGQEHHGLDGVELNWSLNGAIDPILPLEAGQTARLRWYNVSNTGYLNLDGPVRWVAGDQGVFSAEALGRQLMGPGDRRDAVVRMGDSSVTMDNSKYSLYGGIVDEGKPSMMLEVVPSGGAAAPGPLAWGFDDAKPTVDPGSTDILWVLQGDGSTGAWFINGEQFPDVTMPVLAPDEPAVIEIRNVSSTDHPFHLHGHAFEVLSIDGEAPEVRRVEDTINVPIRSIVRLRIVGGLPGSWMAHCHILPHAEGGMMTLIKVEE